MPESTGLSSERLGALAEELAPLAVSYGLSLLGAVLVLLVGLWLSGRVKRGVAAMLGRAPEMDPMLVSFLSSLAKYVVMALTVILVLGQFGIETTSIIALLGAAGLAVGLALQGTLSNIAAGVMLLLFRPFRVGHYVEVAGHAGTVKEVNLFTTELATPDNVQIIVPNGEVWGTAVTNFSAHATRRVDLVAGISYGDDIGKAMDVLKRMIDQEPRIHRDPEPFMAVTNLGDFSVDITLRLWCDAGEYWGLKFDLTRRIKEEFDRNGVDIPFPTQTHLQKAAS